ncbi:MAG TPA: hypothetical protein VGI86_18195 [Acidimicrobiia bacterium]
MSSPTLATLIAAVVAAGAVLAGAGLPPYGFGALVEFELLAAALVLLVVLLAFELLLPQAAPATTRSAITPA